MTDLILAQSGKAIEEIRKNFWYDGEILESGSPRADIFFNISKELIDNIKSRLGVPSNKKMLLYAPTFRNNPEDNLSACRLDFDRLLKVIEKKFGGEWVALIRFHPNVARHNLTARLVTLSDKILDATHYPDMQELLAASDVLITDYSSTVVEFMLMHKPIFLYTKDIKTYPKERELKQVYFDLPFARNRTEAELFDCIKRYDAAAIRGRVDKFLAAFDSFDDGHASERVVDRIVEVIEGGRADFK